MPTISVATYDDAGSAASTLILGDDLTIRYTVSGSGSEAFVGVDIEVRAPDGTVVAAWTGEAGSLGDHEVIWEGGRWTTGTHSGAYAKPLRDGYSVTATGHRGGETRTATATVTTELIVATTLEDPIPTSGEISSGIDPDALDGSDVITAALKPTGSGDTIDSDATSLDNRMDDNLDFDADTGPGGNEVRSVDATFTFGDVPEGDYIVVLRNVRDLAGNTGVQGGSTGEVTNWTIRLR